MIHYAPGGNETGSRDVTGERGRWEVRESSLAEAGAGCKVVGIGNDRPLLNWPTSVSI